VTNFELKMARFVQESDDWTPEEMAAWMPDLLDMAAELSARMRLSPEAFAQLALKAWCERNDKELTHFDAESEPAAGPRQPNTSIVCAMAAKWREGN
jgi:hypothetical protein